jgi:hypothetical protein
MLNTRFLLAIQSDRGVQIINYWHNNSPILVSSRLTPYKPEELQHFLGQPEFIETARRIAPDTPVEKMRDYFKVRWIIEKTGVSPQNNICETILVNDLDQIEIFDHPAEIELLEHRIWNNRVELRINATAPCYARLAYSHFPQLEVRIDGQRIEPHETAGHFIALPLPAGQHHIVLEPRLSFTRRLFLTLNLILWASTTALWIRQWRRR